jgi:hypothetical protein
MMSDEENISHEINHGLFKDNSLSNHEAELTNTLKSKLERRQDSAQAKTHEAVKFIIYMIDFSGKCVHSGVPVWQEDFSVVGLIGSSAKKSLGFHEPFFLHLLALGYEVRIPSADSIFALFAPIIESRSLPAVVYLRHFAVLSFSCHVSCFFTLHRFFFSPLLMTLFRPLLLIPLFPLLIFRQCNSNSKKI